MTIASILPWYQDPWIWFLFITVFSLLALVGLGFGGYIAKSRRRLFQLALEQAQEAITELAAHMPEAEWAVRSLPVQSRYAGPLVREFPITLTHVRTLQTQIVPLSHLGLAKQVRNRYGEEAQDLCRLALRTQTAMMAVLQAGRLYAHAPGWYGAWEAQVRPVLADLAGLSALEPFSPDAAEETDGRSPGPSANAKITRWAASARPRVEALGLRLQRGEIDPDGALDELAQVRLDLSEQLSVWADAVIAASARDDEKARLMKATVEDAHWGPLGADASPILDFARGTGSVWTLTSVLTALLSADAAVSRADVYENLPAMVAATSALKLR